MYAAGKVCLYSATYVAIPCPIDRRLDAHLMVFADSLAFPSAGSRMLISSAIIPITTNSSTRVNPSERRCLILNLLPNEFFVRAGLSSGSVMGVFARRATLHQCRAKNRKRG